MILVCGASGLVGKEMCNLLDEKNVNYIGTYNTNKIDKPNMFQVDFSNPEVLEAWLLTYQVTCCIFCIVERLTDVCERNWSAIKKTNVDLVHITSYLCNKLNIKFIHLSTDYVFDGSTQPNLPDSLKNPLQNYGISKLIAEYRVLTNNNNTKNYCIIRTPVLYSPISKTHDNAVCLIGKNLMDLRGHNVFKEDNYCIRRPLYIADLCHFIYDCATMIEYTGIYHFYNPHNKYTKYEICQRIGEYLDPDIFMNKITPNNDSNNASSVAPRPYDTQLADDRVDITKYNFTPFDESIAQCFQRYKHPLICNSNKTDFFIMLDMDGTIIDTTSAHYNAYRKCFENRNLPFLTTDEWNNIIINGNIDDYLYTVFDNDKHMVEICKQEKRNRLREDDTISFTKNSESFLLYLIQNEYNFCVVTNTNEETVAIFKEKLPILNEIKQWVCRESYNSPKPNSECYELAKRRYYKDETHVIGIEDSMVGYKALKPVTDLIYIYTPLNISNGMPEGLPKGANDLMATLPKGSPEGRGYAINESVFKSQDCYLFDDYTQIYFSQ